MGRRRGPSGPWWVRLISSLVGSCANSTSAAIAVHQADENDPLSSRNDYELVVRASKELEYILESQLGATGKGLHEKTTSVQHMLPKDLVRQIRYLATIRNKLVHECGFNSIPDRPTFINNFRRSRSELQAVLAKHGRGAAGGPGDICAIM